MLKHNLNYFTEVSAKTGQGIREVVEYVSKTLYHEYKEKLYEVKDNESSSSRNRQ